MTGHRPAAVIRPNAPEAFTPSFPPLHPPSPHDTESGLACGRHRILVCNFCSKVNVSTPWSPIEAGAPPLPYSLCPNISNEVDPLSQAPDAARLVYIYIGAPNLWTPRLCDPIDKSYCVIEYFY